VKLGAIDNKGIVIGWLE